MTNARFACLIALPILSAGIIGGAALGLAGAANASTYADTDDAGVETSIVAYPDTYAYPAPTVVPWGLWVAGPSVYVPHVDNTVHQSR